MSISTVIFDMDGLLSDTESVHMLSYQKTLEKYDFSLSDQEYIDHWITNGFGIYEFLKNKSLNLDYLHLRKEKTEIFHKLLHEKLNPMPYAKEIVHNLFGKKKMALASSAHREDVDSVLKLLELDRFFDVIVSGSEVSRSKPAPDIFIFAAEKLNVNPSECIVLEDALKGVIAANSAKMKVIAIPNIYTESNDFSTADYVMDSLRDAEKVILEM